jgi:hypothetical protein
VKTKYLFRQSGIILLSVSIVMIMTCGPAGAQRVNSLGASFDQHPQQMGLLLSECAVDGGNIQTYLDNPNCMIVTVKGSSDPNNPREYFHRGWYNLARSGVTLKADGYAVTRAIEVPGSNNVVRGFIITDPDSEAGIRIYGNNNLIENNEIFHMKQDGIWFFGSYNIFRGNYIHDILAPSITGDPHADCFQTFNWNWDTVGNVFENNICDHNRTSGSNQIFMIGGSRISDTTIRNNRFIMHDAGYSPVALWGGSIFHIENNYICNTTGRGDEAVYISGGSNVTIIGNEYTGYTNLKRGTALTSDNVRGLLPCVVLSDAKPIPPTLTHTATPQIISTPLPGLSWEAEQGEITAPFAAMDGVVSQNTLTDNPSDGGRALYRFSIQDAGDYMVKAIINAADASSNSFFVGMDTEPDTSMIWDIVLTNGFEERAVSWREGAAPDGNASTPKVFSLTPGEHTLIFQGREANTLLDKVEVAKVPVVQPTITAPPAVTLTQTPIPVPPTLTPTNAPIPVIPSPTITAAPTNVNSPSPLPGLSWEAEQGEITPPFTVENGIVSQNTASDDPSVNGRALYRFTIQEAGDYVVRAIVNAADSGKNSFFVGMDSEPATNMIWDIILTNGFEERTVSWREGAAPEANSANAKVFNLAAGEHILIIRGREKETLLDKVEVVKAPIVQPTNTAIPTITSLPTQTPIIAATPTVAIAETSTSTPIIYTNTPLPSETPLPTFTATPSDTTPPTIINITNNNYTQWLVTFSEDIGGTGSNTSNFSLNGASGGPVVIDSISYDSNSYTTTLNVNGGNPLPPDDYTLWMAGTSSITDLAGNKLDGNADGIGGDDFVHGFSIQPPTATPTESPVPVPPTPTETPVPPTATATETPVPATSTPTPEPPTATMTASPVPPSPTPTATLSETVYDDTDSSFLYSSGWNDEWKRSAYGGSFKQTTQDGSIVTLNFTGQSFTILYKSGREYRTIDVYVDGILVGSINETGWRQAFQQRWDFPGQLATGPHTLKLVFVTENKRDRTKGSLDAVIVR